MFDLSWSEIALLVIVALIFIGPKDLPVAMRAVSRGIRHIRRVAAEFQTHVEDMVREADLSETRDELRELRRFDLRRQVTKLVDSDHSLHRGLALDPHERGADSLPRVPAPPPPPPYPGPDKADRPYNALMKEKAEFLARAPHILPPMTVLRLLEEQEHWRKPSVLPPEVALHGGRRVVISARQERDRGN